MNSKKKYRCDMCRGKKYVIDTGAKVFTGICTFGLLPVLDGLFCGPDKKESVYSETCPECCGKGFVYRDYD